jgi:ABC-type multidrug transport system fused ATPase/permease subunit
LNLKLEIDTFFAFIRTFVYPHWKIGTAIFFTTLLSSGLRIVRPLLILFLIDNILPNKDFPMLKGVFFLYFLNVILGYVILLIQDFLIESTRQKIKFFIQLKLFKHIQLLPLSFFIDKESGYLSTRILSDTETLDYMFVDTFANLITNIITVAGILITTFAINGTIASIMILLIPPHILLSVMFIGKLKQVTNETQEMRATLGQEYQETFGAIYFIKSFGLEKIFDLKLVRKLKFLVRRSVLREYLRSLSSNTTSLFTAISTWVIIYILGIDILQERSSIGVIYVIIVYLNMFFSSVQSLIYTNTRFQQSVAIIRRIYQILEEPISNEYRKGVTINNINKGIVYRNVTFSYNSDKKALNKINLFFKKDKITAVVGKTGSGKTTLINLLLGLFESYEGNIFFDNLELRQIDKKTLRSIMALVPQAPFLFSASVRDNISLGNPRASYEMIIQAAKLSNAHDFIIKLPNQYDTFIGEKGIRLSGGEKQRLALARAIIRNPAVLIIDEGTSQIDSNSEDLILESLRYLKKGRIIILIAHRLSTILVADRIIVLDAGRIVGAGTHDYLLVKCPHYRSLFESQISQGILAVDTR